MIFLAENAVNTFHYYFLIVILDLISTVINSISALMGQNHFIIIDGIIKVNTDSLRSLLC